MTREEARRSLIKNTTLSSMSRELGMWVLNNADHFTPEDVRRIGHGAQRWLLPILVRKCGWDIRSKYDPKEMKVTYRLVLERPAREGP